MNACIQSWQSWINENCRLLLCPFLTVHTWFFRTNDNKGLQIWRQEQWGQHLGAANLDQWVLQTNKYIRSAGSYTRKTYLALSGKEIVIPARKLNKPTNKTHYVLKYFCKFNAYITSQWLVHHEIMREALVHCEIRYQYSFH